MTTAKTSQPLCERRSTIRTGAALLALLSFTSTACTTVHNVPRSELAKLNGFHEEKSSFLSSMWPPGARSPTYQLVDEDGRIHVFDSSSRLVLDIRSAGNRDELEARYRQIFVDPGLFLGLERDSSREIRVPLVQIERAGLRKFSWGKTIGLTAGLLGTSLLALVLVTLALPSDGSQHHHHDWD